MESGNIVNLMEETPASAPKAETEDEDASFNKACMGDNDGNDHADNLDYNAFCQ
jgi:hypothetical protein